MKKPESLLPDNTGNIPVEHRSRPSISQMGHGSGLDEAMIRRSIKKGLRFSLNRMPRKWAGLLVERQPRLVPHLDSRDVPIRISNAYYGDCQFWLSNRYRIESQILYHHCFDEKSLLYFMRIVKEGDVCVDVGANIGSLTLSLAHRVGHDGHVVAIEPGPVLADRLRRNVAASNRTNVEVCEVGLSDAEGELYWKLDTGPNAGNAFLSSEPTDIVVPVVALDSLSSIKRHSHIDFIKIDVEGMEAAVIRGAMQTIQNHKPAILIETLIDADEGSSGRVAQVMGMLADLGYATWEIDVPERQLMSYAPAFTFIPCSYPNLPQNTLCIHEARADIVALASGG